MLRRKQATTRSITFIEWLNDVSPDFTWDWAYLQYIQDHLQKVTDSEIKKLMLFMPPRHGKSALTTVRYPIYRMEQNLGIRVMLWCYDQSLANLFSRQSRRIAQDRGFRGGEIRAQDEWETIGGGSFRAVGVGGGITGRGADLIIIDDPIRSREEANSERWRDRIFDWYTNDIYTRLEPGGAIILIQTRWHEDDLAGRILASPDGPNWTVIQLPAEAEKDDPIGREEGAALCPERFDLPALYDIKSVMGLDYYALYQQRPMAQEGGLYKKAWFRYATAEEVAEPPIWCGTGTWRKASWMPDGAI